MTTVISDSEEDEEVTEVAGEAFVDDVAVTESVTESDESDAPASAPAPEGETDQA